MRNEGDTHQVYRRTREDSHQIVVIEDQIVHEIGEAPPRYSNRESHSTQSNSPVPPNTGYLNHNDNQRGCNPPGGNGLANASKSGPRKSNPYMSKSSLKAMIQPHYETDSQFMIQSPES